MAGHPPVPSERQPPRWRERVRGVFGHGWSTLKLAFRAHPSGTVGFVALTVVAAFMSPAVAWVGKLIVDGVVHSRGQPLGSVTETPAFKWLVVELGLVVAFALVERALGLVRQIAGARLGIHVNVLILEKALGLELSHFEDSEFYDKLTRARREASFRPLALVGENLLILRNVLTLAGYAGLIFVFKPWMILVLFLAALPAFLSETRFSTAAFRLRNWRAPETRRLTYTEYVLANDEHAKEVKLFDLGPFFLERYKTLSETIYREDRDLAVKRTIWGYLLGILSTVAFYACYVLIVIATLQGRLSLGDMTLYLVAFRSGQQALTIILSSLSGLYEHNLYMSNLFEYLHMPTAAEKPLPPAARVRDERGVRFEDVGFRYPGSDKWALRHIDLFIPAGQSLALVGENGAGKTTFIKLLTGLYAPTEGRVLLDGQDLQSWPPQDVRRRIGVIFQDFNQYQLLVRENVGVGSIENVTDEGRVSRAVSRGGAAEVVGTLGKGLDTQLGKWFREGVELSGGQWQKIALARAFMREEADILVLDEPTAALDAQAEHAVFQRFRELAQGRTTIVISHRFPTVRMADRILVLEHGQVIEAGTHDDLLARRGRYAHLFQLQAAGYQ